MSWSADPLDARTARRPGLPDGPTDGLMDGAHPPTLNPPPSRGQLASRCPDLARVGEKKPQLTMFRRHAFRQVIRFSHRTCAHCAHTSQADVECGNS